MTFELPTIPPVPTFSARHREVLDAAMALIAERGFAGASLRELARQVKISQPSLYTYFDSKDALVDQICLNYSGAVMTSHMQALASQGPPMDDLGGIFRFVMRRVMDVWNNPQHVVFVRFLFATTMEDPASGARFRELFLDRACQMSRVLMAPFIERGEILAADADRLFRLTINGLVFELMQERVLFVGLEDDMEEFADFIVDVAVTGACERAKRAQKEQT